MNDSDRSLAIVAAICLASQLVTDDPAADMWDAVQYARSVARCFGVTPSECVTAPDGRPVIDALPWEDLRPIVATVEGVEA